MLNALVLLVCYICVAGLVLALFDMILKKPNKENNHENIPAPADPSVCPD